MTGMIVRIGYVKKVRLYDENYSYGCSVDPSTVAEERPRKEALGKLRLVSL